MLRSFDHLYNRRAACLLIEIKSVLNPYKVLQIPPCLSSELFIRYEDDQLLGKFRKMLGYTCTVFTRKSAKRRIHYERSFLLRNFCHSRNEGKAQYLTFTC